MNQTNNMAAELQGNGVLRELCSSLFTRCYCGYKITEEHVELKKEKVRGGWRKLRIEKIYDMYS